MKTLILALLMTVVLVRTVEARFTVPDMDRPLDFCRVTQGQKPEDVNEQALWIYVRGFCAGYLKAEITQTFREAASKNLKLCAPKNGNIKNDTKEIMKLVIEQDRNDSKLDKAKIKKDLGWANLDRLKLRTAILTVYKCK